MQKCFFLSFFKIFEILKFSKNIYLSLKISTFPTCVNIFSYECKFQQLFLNFYPEYPKMVKLEVKYDFSNVFSMQFSHSQYKKHLMLDKMAQVVIWKESSEIFSILFSHYQLFISLNIIRS